MQPWSPRLAEPIPLHPKMADRTTNRQGDRMGTYIAMATTHTTRDDEPGISQSLLEAMAAGKPVIASDTASHRAFLEDGVHTHFAALNDRTSLAKCGRRLLLDPAAAAAIGAAGQARVLERFGADAFVEAHRQLYDSLAAGARPSLAIRSA